MKTTTRERAATLVEQLRDGIISNFDFEGSWPIDRHDRALTAIGAMLWRYYDDFYEHNLVEEHRLPDQDRALFDRCVLFLRSAVEFQWKQARFDTSVPPLDPSQEWPLAEESEVADRRSLRREDVWPFFRIADLERERG